MATNFDFLKSVDKNLFEIITEAEKLYRDEYLNNVWDKQDVLGNMFVSKFWVKNRTSENTFDQMLATLKDKGNGSEQEKEFVNDLYFLKKHGNESVHSAKVKKDGMEALECLQRAFEVGINYAVYNKKAKTNILKLRYDTELLVTGKKSKKSLSEKYLEEKAKEKSFTKRKNPPKTRKSKSSKKQVYSMKSESASKGIPFYWIFVGFSFVVAVVVMLILVL